MRAFSALLLAYMPIAVFSVWNLLTFMVPEVALKFRYVLILIFRLVSTLVRYSIGGMLTLFVMSSVPSAFLGIS